MKKLVLSIESRLITFEKAIAALSLLLLLVLSIFQILVRNLFDFGFPEIEIINRNLLIICGAMGAVLATSQFRHIKIDALTPLLSSNTLENLRIPLGVFSAMVCAMMAYYAAIFSIDEWQYTPANERWTLPFTLIYPFGFCLISFHFLATCFRQGKR